MASMVVLTSPYAVMVVVGVELLSMVSGLAFSVGRRRLCRLQMASVVVSTSPGPTSRSLVISCR
jgi:hypothetical protein